MTMSDLKLGAEEKRPAKEAKPFRIRRTGTDKTLREFPDEESAHEFVANNYPRAHHEADDHDVYVEAPNGSKTCYTAGSANGGWSDYKTPREREDD